MIQREAPFIGFMKIGFQLLSLILIGLSIPSEKNLEI